MNRLCNVLEPLFRMAARDNATFACHMSKKTLHERIVPARACSRI